MQMNGNLNHVMDVGKFEADACSRLCMAGAALNDAHRPSSWIAAKAVLAGHYIRATAAPSFAGPPRR